MNDYNNLGENDLFQKAREMNSKIEYSDYSIKNIYITMRDNVKIAASICIPQGFSSKKKFTTLLYQTRYWRASELNIPFRWFLKEVATMIPITEIFISRGYAVVYTDVRGCGASSGSREIPFSIEETKDGSEIIDWIISQPWSDGSVVSNGISYTGWTAEMLATNNHSALKAIILGHSGWDSYDEIALPGGCYNTAFMQTWSFVGRNLDQNNASAYRLLLPLTWLLMKGVKTVDNDIDARELQKSLNEHRRNCYVYEMTQDKPYKDDIFGNNYTYNDLSPFQYKDKLQTSMIPILSWCSWLDSGYVDAVIKRFINLSNPQIAIIGDWSHGSLYSANPYFPSRSVVSPTIEERVNTWIDFFDKCVRGEKIQEKILYYYTMGEEKWKFTKQWPPKNQETKRWYLSEGAMLTLDKPLNDSGEEKYKVNYRATTGRNNRWWAPLGIPIDYSNRRKADEKLLTYDSPPLQEDMEITGFPIITLNLSSTHEDGAIFVYLEDINENGDVTYCTDGHLRLIHRKLCEEEPPYELDVPYHSFKKKDAYPLNSSEINKITFGLHVTSVLIRKGHKMRIAIAGADKDTFPRFPAEGKPTITISRNKYYPSYLEIPIIKNRN